MQAKPDYEIVRPAVDARSSSLYEQEGRRQRPSPILNTKWDYYVDGKIDPRPGRLGAQRVPRARAPAATPPLKTRRQTSAAVYLREIWPRTAPLPCGMWIYTGLLRRTTMRRSIPLAAGHRAPTTAPMTRRVWDCTPKWAYAWPLQPPHHLQPRLCRSRKASRGTLTKKLVEWTGSKWDQVDVADFVAASNGDARAARTTRRSSCCGNRALASRATAWATGRCPSTTSRSRSPLSQNNQINGSRSNSPCVRWARATRRRTRGDRSEDYPIAATTYSVTEQWQTGGPDPLLPGARSRPCPPSSSRCREELAAEKGISPGRQGAACATTAARSRSLALVATKRLKPLTVNGATRAPGGPDAPLRLGGRLRLRATAW